MIIRSDLIHQHVEKMVKYSHSRDPVRIIDDHEVYLYSRPLKHLLGMYTIVLDQRCILLNSKLASQNRRIVLAHELGHDQLHRSLVPDLGFFSDQQMLSATSVTEYEANTFAAHLLVSDDSVSEWLGDGYDEQQMASAASVPLSLMLIKLQAFSREHNLSLELSRPPNHNFLQRS